MSEDNQWSAVIQVCKLIGFLALLGLIYAVGTGRLNVDFVLKFSDKALELLKSR